MSQNYLIDCLVETSRYIPLAGNAKEYMEKYKEYNYEEPFAVNTLKDAFEEMNAEYQQKTIDQVLTTFLGDYEFDEIVKLLIREKVYNEKLLCEIVGFQVDTSNKP